MLLLLFSQKNRIVVSKRTLKENELSDLMQQHSGLRVGRDERNHLRRNSRGFEPSFFVLAGRTQSSPSQFWLELRLGSLDTKTVKKGLASMKIKHRIKKTVRWGGRWQKWWRQSYEHEQACKRFYKCFWWADIERALNEDPCQLVFR